MAKHRVARIDDEFDAAKAAYPEKQEDVPANITLKVASLIPLLSPVAGVVSEARAYFSGKAMGERANALIEAVNEKADHLAGRVQRSEKAIEDIQARIQSREFGSAFREASVQALLSTEPTKITDYAAVLGGSLGAHDWREISSNLTSYIKAIAQLGEKDMECLRLLNSTFADVVKTYPNMHDPNPFTEKAQELLKVAGQAGFHRDDFYAYCRRLEGFGLAIEVPRNTSRMAPGDYCFRPTRSGVRLIELLADEKDKPQWGTAGTGTDGKSPPF